MVGGNTLCTTMGINAAGSQVQKDANVAGTVEDFVTAQLNNEDARENLVRALCERSGETIDFFSSLGVEFTVGGNSDFMLITETDGKPSVTMVNAAYKALKETAAQLYLNTEVTDLTTNNGVVTGCVATDAAGNQVTFAGKSVILCTGGFGQNRELLGQVRLDLATTVTDEIAPTTGQGLMLAQKLGAATVNLDSIQLFPHVVPSYGLIVPFGIPGGFHPNAIYVNNATQRFVVEGFEVSDAILAQDEGEVFCIFAEEAKNDMMTQLEGLGYVVSGETPPNWPPTWACPRTPSPLPLSSGTPTAARALTASSAVPTT